jgi:hypothetical protein
MPCRRRVEDLRLRYGPAVSETRNGPEGHSGLQRPLALLILLAVGVLSLPISAAFEGEGDNSENWILPIAIGGAAVVGALVGAVLPGLAGAHATRAKGMLAGAILGVVMLVLGTLLFFWLIAG